MSFPIRRAAVIGAGTMGAAIAGLIAGAGVPVLLLDVPPTELTSDETARGLTLDHPAVRNRIVRQGFERMRAARPANLYNAQTADLITLGNTSDDFDKLAEADWILEAIVEQLAPKQALMERIEALRKPDALVTTNTSGIPISQIGQGRSQAFRAHFFGTHFFNPPRYLKLVEIIPGGDTNPEAVAAMRTFVERTLGKGVVLCNDRPNFVANRLGIFSIMNDLRFILDNDYTVEQVDALTGPLVGRPSTATFRLLDLIGIDVLAFIAGYLHKVLADDESRATFQPLPLINEMVAAGRLGNKSGQGFYRGVRAGGKREFQPLDLRAQEYQSPAGYTSSLIDKARQIQPLPERLHFLLQWATDDPADRDAQFVAHTILPLLGYAAHRLPEITSSVAAVDNAMRWGFNHELGPFEIWQALGVAETAALMRVRDIAIAPWVEQLIAQGNAHFYQQQDGQTLAYNVATRQYQPIAQDDRIIDLTLLKQQRRELRSNASASLIDLGDGVLGLEFHSKANSLEQHIVALGLEALHELQQDQWHGLVIGNQGKNFCAGANLRELTGVVQQGRFDQLEEIIAQYQQWMQSLRYAPKPVVTAPFGRVLGGGAEVAMHSTQTVAAAETYMGLIEVGVGVIPAAGGCKELNRRLIAGAAATPGGNPQAALLRVLEIISQATVSTSASEARDLGFLRATDQIVMNDDHLLGAAKQAVLELAASYTPPLPGKHCYALGRDGLAALRVAIYTFQQAGYASEYDAAIAERLAYVLCGGELSSPQWVAEQYILDLERQMFLELCREPRTHERVRAILETGKPLRN